MRPKFWLVLALAILLLDAITVTWITARHIASAQVPASTGNGTAQNASDSQTNRSLPDEVKIEVEPPKFPVAAPGNNAHLPEVPSLSTPQLPQTSIDHALIDEMRKIFAEPKSTLGDSAAPKTKPVDQSRQHLSLESVDRRLEIVQHLTASARLMVHEGRNQLHSGSSDEADRVINMSRQLQVMITQLLDNH